MAAEPQLPPRQWEALSKQLLARGKASGLGREDAEDRAQDALLRVVEETPREGVPPIEARAGRAHQLAVIDEVRRRTRLKEVPPSARLDIDGDEAREIGVEQDFERRLRFMGMVEAVRDLAGPNSVKLLLEGLAGYTEAESGQRASAGAPSTAALRKRISRATPEIAERISHLKGER